jgi:hypothetical protein
LKPDIRRTRKVRCLIRHPAGDLREHITAALDANDAAKGSEVSHPHLER